MRLPRFKSGRHIALDATGISLSALCVLHCLAFPAAAVAAPMLAPEVSELFGVGHDWHLVLLVLAAPVSLLALGWSVRTTRGGWPVLLVGLLGLGLMAVGASHVFDRTIETVLTLSGVTVLAGAHFANWVRRGRAGHVHARDCGLCEHSTGH